MLLFYLLRIANDVVGTLLHLWSLQEIHTVHVFKCCLNVPQTTWWRIFLDIERPSRRVTNMNKLRNDNANLVDLSYPRTLRRSENQCQQKSDLGSGSDRPIWKEACGIWKLENVVYESVGWYSFVRIRIFTVRIDDLWSSGRSGKIYHFKGFAVRIATAQCEYTHKNYS